MDNKTFVKVHPFNCHNMKLKEGLETEVAIGLYNVAAAEKHKTGQETTRGHKQNTAMLCNDQWKNLQTSIRIEITFQKNFHPISNKPKHGSVSCPDDA